MEGGRGVLKPLTCRTGRMRRTAEVLTRLRVSSDGLPGSPTTMLRPPCELISASATPEASTRWRMIWMAWLTSDRLMSDPSVVTGVRMI